MATVGVGTKSRDKKGFFVRLKEKGRREVLFQGNDLKCIKGNGPDYISSLFEPRILRYNVTNREHNLTQLFYNNRYYHNSFTYKASHLWNQLPSYIKRSTALSEFLKQLISFDLINLRVSCKCSFCMSLGFYSILDVFIYFFYLKVFNLFLGFLIFN